MMFGKFRENMMYAADLDENRYPNDTINWNFVDSDMYRKWRVLLDGATYTDWFDRVADEIEGIEA